MVLKKAALGFAVAGLLATSAQAQVDTGLAVMTAAHVQKAVPRTDKSAVEVVGTVRQTFSVTECGTTSTLVILNVNGLLPGVGVPVSGTCAGPLARACKALRPGSRIRLQGLMAPLPNPTTEGFDLCDADTWQTFLTAQTFVVLKVLK